MIVGKSGLHFKACTSNAFLNVQKMVSKLRFWSSFLRRCVGDSSVSRQFPTFRINHRRSRALCTIAQAKPVAQPHRAESWIHGKRAVVEPTGLLSAQQLAQRVCAYFGCSYEPHLSLPHSDEVP